MPKISDQSRLIDLLPLTVGRLNFVYDRADLWKATDPETGKAFELTMQLDPDGEPDWGVWDVNLSDWAHDETGYCTAGEALQAFRYYLDETS